MVKLLRAHGGCLGRRRRRRTWQAAISLGGKTAVRSAESIGGHERTQGSEPSQYLEEKKAIAIPKVVASEIGTAQTCCTLKDSFGFRVSSFGPVSKLET